MAETGLERLGLGVLTEGEESFKKAPLHASPLREGSRSGAFRAEHAWDTLSGKDGAFAPEGGGIPVDRDAPGGAVGVGMLPAPGAAAGAGVAATG
jgi:hypothetical protein